MLWEADAANCPFHTSRLEERLKEARINAQNNLVDMENVDPKTFGVGGFKDPGELLLWLENNRPKEDIVLTYEDFCLPNVFVKDASLRLISSLVGMAGMPPIFSTHKPPEMFP